MNNIQVNRGDVYIADLRGKDCGLHGFIPVIIVQNDIGNYYSPTTIVVPVFNLAQPSKCCIPIKGQKLSKHSVALCDKAVCIDKSRLRSFVCHLEQNEMKKVTNALKMALTGGDLSR